jgi:hypothetical protein
VDSVPVGVSVGPVGPAGVVLAGGGSLTPPPGGEDWAVGSGVAEPPAGGSTARSDGLPPALGDAGAEAPGEAEAVPDTGGDGDMPSRPATPAGPPAWPPECRAPEPPLRPAEAAADRGALGSDSLPALTHAATPAAISVTRAAARTPAETPALRARGPGPGVGRTAGAVMWGDLGLGAVRAPVRTRAYGSGLARRVQRHYGPQDTPAATTGSAVAAQP